MAADLTESTAESAPKTAARRHRAPRRRYATRFLLVYGVLVAVLGGAAAGFVLLLDKPGHKAGATWSSWRPVGTDPSLVIDQIAQHVGGEYRFTDGKALVAVQAAPPSVLAQVAPTALTLPVVAVELRGQAAIKGSIVVHRTNRAWQFQLCGGGTACSISRGKPSNSRGQLVRREALELALHTFKYVPDIDSVIVVLPPAPPITQNTPHYVLYLRRGDLGKQLTHPLRTSLPPAPPLKLKAQPLSSAPIDRFALSRLYTSQPQQLQDGSVVLVLDPT